jgi:hypothetical protein
MQEWAGNDGVAHQGDALNCTRPAIWFALCLLVLLCAIHGVAQVDDVPIVDQRECDREEVKTNLQSIMRNRLLSETARVAAARELSRILDNEELQEMREEVRRLTAIIEANTSDESELPPHLRRRR